MHDVCIVGAGPAGLNAALILGRCRRSVLVFDSGQPRNWASRGLHGFVSRDGISPLELRRLGRDELERYPLVGFHDGEVVDVRRHTDRFEIVANNRPAAWCRFLLLATGREDVLPELPGVREFYGRGVYHCPYCDGWEHRDRRLIAYGAGLIGDLALELLTWSDHVTLCPSEPETVTASEQRKLLARGVAFAAAPVAELKGDAENGLRSVRLTDGSSLPCEALFFRSDCRQRSPLAEKLGCRLDEFGSVICQGHAATGVPGLYVAGNVRGGLHLAVMAAAEGAEAAVAINEALLDQKLL